MGELEECGRGGKGADGPKREVHGGRRRCQVQEREGERETDRHRETWLITHFPI